MILRTTYCCNLNPIFVAPEHHKPRPAFSQRLGKLIKKTKVVFWEGFWVLPLLKPKTLEALPPHSYISSLNGYYEFFRLGLSDLLEPLLISSGFIVEKPSPLLIDPALAGKVPTLQQKIEAGIDTPSYPKSLYTWYRRVFLCQPFMVAQVGHLHGGRNLWNGSVNPAWAATILRLTPHGGSIDNPKRLPV